jgi:Fe-S cluster assembly protein SufD
VVDGHSTAIFNGMIDIAPHAQKISAQQMSRSLILAPGAQAVLKPQMVILADDVKCTHGATVGQLDEDAYFYLLSRGIDGPTAKQMLTFAFLAEALTDLPVFLRQPLMDQLCDWLGMDKAITEPLQVNP